MAYCYCTLLDLGPDGFHANAGAVLRAVYERACDFGCCLSVVRQEMSVLVALWASALLLDYFRFVIFCAKLRAKTADIKV